MKKFLMQIAIACCMLSPVMLAGCESDATVASRNISKAADNFEIPRRIVFYNGITGDAMLEIVGMCSQENLGNRLAVTCKTEHGEYKKHFLGLSHNVTYFSEQLTPVKASTQRYRVVFKPSVLLPEIELR